MRTYEDVLRNMGLKEGLEKGRREGQEEVLQEIARNMLSLNCSIDLIQKATKLPKNVIEKLAPSVPLRSSPKISPTA